MVPEHLTNKAWLLAAAFAVCHLCLAQRMMSASSGKWSGILRQSYLLLPSWRPCELCKPEELGKALPFLPVAQAVLIWEEVGGPQVFLSLQSAGSIPVGTPCTTVCVLSLYHPPHPSHRSILLSPSSHTWGGGTNVQETGIADLPLRARLMWCKGP